MLNMIGFLSFCGGDRQSLAQSTFLLCCLHLNRQLDRKRIRRLGDIYNKYDKNAVRFLYYKICYIMITPTIFMYVQDYFLSIFDCCT